MATSESQQIYNAIKRSKRPLICVPELGGADAYAASIGMARVLQKLEKEAHVVAVDGKTPKNLHFLKDHHHVREDVENLQKFVIELDASKTPVDELSYEMKEDRLFVYLSPKSGTWDQRDVTLSSSGYRYDLIICIGSPDLTGCAHVYEQNPDFFFRTPIINIDHSPSNEHYGQFNVVDLSASAIGEVCHDLVHAMEPEFLDEEVATAFLTGMIAKTKSFKKRTVTARTLQTASNLIAKGARRDTIVEHLYRTRSVSTLRLWGRALARLKAEENQRLVWSLLSQQDFLHAGAQEHDLPDVIDELISSSPDANVVILFYEDKHKDIHAIIRVEHGHDAQRLVANLNPTGSREEARVTFKQTHIVEAEKALISALKKTLV